LITPVEQSEKELLFDAAAAPRLRTIVRLRRSLGINLAGIAVILDLLDKLCALQPKQRGVAQPRLTYIWIRTESSTGAAKGYNALAPSVRAVHLPQSGKITSIYFVLSPTGLKNINERRISHARSF
jgi:hypothetical protein